MVDGSAVDSEDTPNDSGWFPLVTQLPLAVLIETEHRRVSLTNGPFCSLFDLPLDPDELLGADCQEAMERLAPVFDDPSGFKRRVEELVASGEPCGEETIRLADGRVLLRDFFTSKSESGAKRNVWLYRDVTSQMQAEDAIREARDRAMDLATQRANLISLISHEIRTPLSGTVGLVDLLLDQPLPPAVHEIVTNIQQSSADVIALLEDLLDLSRMDLDSLKLSNETTDVRELVAKAAETVGKVARAKSLVVSIQVDVDVPAETLVDESRLRQVLLNLLGNAVKFTTAGEVSIQVGMADQVLNIAVVDTGPGISDSDKAELFRPFTQGGAGADAESRGAGLGLAISAKLIELMGGRISVESELGSGTRFRVSLPQAGVPEAWPVEQKDVGADLAGMRVLLIGAPPLLRSALTSSLAALGAEVSLDETSEWDATIAVVCSESELEAALAVTARAEAKRAVSLILTPDESIEGTDSMTSQICLLPIRSERLTALLTGSQRTEIPVADRIERFAGEGRVLVVDDAPANRTLLRAMLQLLNLQVELAATGREGVGAVRSQKFDLVLMDVNMPVMDGLEATREIRKSEHDHHTPIIALTASALAGDRQACLDAGMDDYVKKPVSIPDLRTALGKFLEASDERDSRQTAEVLGAAPKTRVPPLVDQQRLEELVDELGDSEIVAESIQMFLDALPNRVGAIQQLVVQKELSDRDKVRSTVHALGSPAAMLGIAQLAQKCKMVEAIAGGEQAVAFQTIEEIVACADTTSLALSDYLRESR